MPTERFSRFRRLCNALPKTKLDRQFESLSLRQKAGVVLVTGVVVVTVPRLVAEPETVPTVAVPLAFGTMWALVGLLAWYNRR